MLAAVYHGPNDLRLEQVKVPTIGPEDVLRKVQAVGICGTDLRIVQGGKIDLSSVVSHRFPLAQALDGFAAAQDRRSLKVVLEA